MNILQSISSDQAFAGPRQWSLICDFDGTVTPFDVTDAILSRFAAPEWEGIEEEWVSGHITARECMARQIALIRADREELDGFLDTVPVDPGFADFAAVCRRKNRPLLIVSDGMDYPIRRILARHGLGALPVIANRLVPSGSDGYCLDFPYGHASCGLGVCKCRVAGSENGKVLLIGDGRSDFCLAGKADLVFAKAGKSLLRHCETKGFPFIAYTDFFDVINLLETLEISGSPATPDQARAV